MNRRRSTRQPEIHVFYRTFCPVNQGGQEGAPEVVGEQRDPKNRYTSHMRVGTGSEEQVAQGQYVVSDTRCPAFHGYKLE